jgi:small subunit ribosomal protein S17
MRTKKGTITSAKMTGTVTVTVHRLVFHPLYKKRFPVSKKFLADPGEFTLHEGDQVVITECRPLSKNKHFRVTEILKKAVQVSDVAEEEAIASVLKTRKNESESESSTSDA